VKLNGNSVQRGRLVLWNGRGWTLESPGKAVRRLRLIGCTFLLGGNAKRTWRRSELHACSVRSTKEDVIFPTSVGEMGKGREALGRKG
jgi:hypothetical protein